MPARRVRLEFIFCFAVYYRECREKGSDFGGWSTGFQHSPRKVLIVKPGRVLPEDVVSSEWTA
jgi:hypothetical protein